jgi:Transcriptional activator of glycolytic enzymes/Centromere DNA-binding protein complex CBF3 subunit, domain 2
MIFPRIEETRAAVENTSISKRDVATQCFLDLLIWFRVVILQDAVFLRKHFPFLNLWRRPPFNHSVFDEFANNLLHEANFGEDLRYVQIAKAVPKVAQLMQDHQQNIISSLSTYHQSSETHRNQIQAQLAEYTDVLKLMSMLVQRLSQDGIQLRTRVTLDNEDIGFTARALTSTSNSQSLAVNSTQPSDDPPIQYQLNANVITITALWEEYSQGIASSPGAIRGPSIRRLDEQFDNKWRRVDPYRKQYSRRRHIWEAILRASENLALPPEMVAEKMERWRLNRGGDSLLKVNNLLSAIPADEPGLWGEKDVELLQVV